MFVIRSGAENKYWLKYGRRWADSLHHFVPNCKVEVHLINPTDKVYEDANKFCDAVDITETNLDPVVYSTYARFLNTRENQATLWCDIDGYATSKMIDIDIENMFYKKPVLRFTRFKGGQWKHGFWLFGSKCPNIINGVKNIVLHTISYNFRWGTDVEVNNYLEQFDQYKVDGICGSIWRFFTTEEKQVKLLEDTIIYD